MTSPTALQGTAWPWPLLAAGLRPRAWGGLGVLALVLLLHAWLLGRMAPGPGPRMPGDAAVPPLQVRQLPRPSAPVLAAEAALMPPGPPARPSLRPRPAPAEVTPPPPAIATEAPSRPDGAELPEGGAPPAAGAPLPTYATRLPPPVTLQFALQRELPLRRELQAELRWRPEGERYTLSLGFAAIGRASVGLLDLHGIAPERHVETRRGRELRAVNFQRDTARITFSGPAVEHSLLPGVQDRLSWMIQLPAVLAANPALAEPGAEVQLQVVGVRGDAAVWRFVAQGREDLDLPAGAVVGALRLHREPQRPYDTRVDVWLDPARHHLPVRVRLQTRAEGEGTDFSLLAYGEP